MYIYTFRLKSGGLRATAAMSEEEARKNLHYLQITELVEKH